MIRTSVLAGVWLAAFVGAACTSPEAERTRGGGAGADPGNRPDMVMMHEGSDPFWNTPERIGDAHEPPITPALQARQMSEP